MKIKILFFVFVTLVSKTVYGQINSPGGVFTSGTTTTSPNLLLSTWTSGTLTTRLTILGATGTTAGYVGINIASPLERLHVSGNTRTTGNFISGGGYLTVSSSLAPMIFQLNTTERMRIVNTGTFAGHVGIGTSPTERLHVSGGNLLVDGGNITTSGNVVTTTGVLNTNSTTNALVFQTNAIERMRILNSNGFIGIGTPTPQINFEVAGNASPLVGQVTRNMSATGYTTFRLYNDQNSSVRALEMNYSGSTYAGSLVPGGPTGESASMSTTGAFPLVLGTSSTARMIITSGGNVGIGTNDPKSFKLAVAGNMVTEDMVIKLQANWPDYVFEPQYKLSPLFELEKFIVANKHLPNIPTAKDVSENGYSVGQLDVSLLKKVEELTLYIIEQQKQIDALRLLVEKK